MTRQARHLFLAIVVMMAGFAGAAEANQPPVITNGPGPGTILNTDEWGSLYFEVSGYDLDSAGVTVTVNMGDGPNSQPIPMSVLDPTPTGFSYYLEYQYVDFSNCLVDGNLSTPIINVCDSGGACTTRTFQVFKGVTCDIPIEPVAQTVCTTPDEPVSFLLQATPGYDGAYIMTTPAVGSLVGLSAGTFAPGGPGFMYPGGAAVAWDPQGSSGSTSFVWAADADEDGFDAWEANFGTVQLVSHVAPVNTTPDQVVCAGATVQLTGTLSEATSSTWKVNGAAISGSSFVASAPPAGQPSVTLTVQLEQTDACGVVDAAEISNVTVKAFNTAPMVSVIAPNSVSEGTAGVVLDGSATYDPEGDALTYVWSQISGPPVALIGGSGPAATFTAPLLSNNTDYVELEFKLVASDIMPAGGCGTSLAASKTVIVTVSNLNQAPTTPTVSATPSTDVVEGGQVTLTATSSDPDGDPLSYTWTCTGGTVSGSGAVVIVVAPQVGASGTIIQCTVVVDDGEGATTTSSITLTIHDQAAPTCNATADLTQLWPPNHKIRPIVLSHGAGEVIVTAVHSDEPTNGLGDGDTAIDAIIDSSGHPFLRAERSGLHNGRVYTVSYKVEVVGGEVVCTGALKVGVPHSAKSFPIDGGALYDATQ